MPTLAELLGHDQADKLNQLAGQLEDEPPAQQPVRPVVFLPPEPST